MYRRRYGDVGAVRGETRIVRVVNAHHGTFSQLVDITV